MLFDMLSTDMYVSFNCKLAQRIGLHTAIYVTELLNISRKAYLKGKLYNEKPKFINVRNINNFIQDLFIKLVNSIRIVKKSLL